jgi:hypothetical protein
MENKIYINAINRFIEYHLKLDFSSVDIKNEYINESFLFLLDLKMKMKEN